MSKYVIFSFDDGRKDQYTNAYRILRKHNMPATINIVSSFTNRSNELSPLGKTSVSWEEVKEMYLEGKWEVACHGATHSNSVEEIVRWYDDDDARDYGDRVGFASPESFLTESNCPEIEKLYNEGRILYMRSGKQTRREGLFYTLKTILNRKIHCSYLFYNLNKDCILDKPKALMKAIGIVNSDTVSEIMYLIKRMNDEEAVILMLHSINDKDNDIWTWSSNKLEDLCGKLDKSEEIVVCTTRDWWNNNV